MKFIINIKNSLPYLLLIAIYFFFINIEAKNDLNSNKNKIEKEKDTNYTELEAIDKTITISIPVIPYK